MEKHKLGGIVTTAAMILLMAGCSSKPAKSTSDTKPKTSQSSKKAKPKKVAKAKVKHQSLLKNAVMAYVVLIPEQNVQDYAAGGEGLTVNNASWVLSSYQANDDDIVSVDAVSRLAK